VKKYPPHIQEQIDRGQEIIDAIVAKYGDGSEVPRATGPEQEVLVPIMMWREVEWLEDDPLSNAIDAAADGPGYAEGEELGNYYVFYIGGELNLEKLRETVQNLLDSRADGKYTATITEEQKVLIGRS
jgi:hypothetical protein